MTYDELLLEMCNGKDHLFIHGGAGSGKSELIHKMQKNDKNVIYAAPSGIAALNIKGATIHSVFSLKPTVQNVNEPIKIKDIEKIKIIKNAKTLLIDEVSMVRCDLFDKIDSCLRKIRENNMPFGGVRIILVGDLFQLGPVVADIDRSYLIKYGYKNDNFEFFNSAIWKENNFISNIRFYELNHNFRQSEDMTFNTILSSIRLGLYDTKKMTLINKRVVNYYDDNCHYLTVRNKTARAINESKLLELKGNQYESVPFVDPLSMSDNNAVRKCPINQVLSIKENMKIMFVMNDGGKNGKRWVNGTIGFISGIKIGVNNYIESVTIDINGKNLDVVREY
ncbi:MAG: AAA family ATPase, partial [Treponema sp.]|nr:AAA family ATPase [Treponema sp.]